MGVEIKKKLLDLRKTQVDLVGEIRRRGETVSRSHLSCALSGVEISPKAIRLVELVKQIIEDWEKEINQR